MRMFAYSGSQREHSFTDHVIELFAQEIQERIPNSTILFDTSSKFDIQFVSGPDMFESGIDPINDDMKMLRENILQSEVVLLATPVYVNHISGSMKTLIDRLASWTHTMDLAGKLGISIAISSSTGEEQACNYQKYFLQQAGASVMDTIPINMSIQTIDDIEKEVSFIAGRVARRYENAEYDISRMQESKFQLYKEKVMKGSLYQAELHKLQAEHIVAYSSYKEYFYSKIDATK